MRLNFRSITQLLLIFELPTRSVKTVVVCRYTMVTKLLKAISTKQHHTPLTSSYFAVEVERLYVNKEVDLIRGYTGIVGSIQLVEYRDCQYIRPNRLFERYAFGSG